MLLKQWTHILKFSVLQSKDGQFFPVIDIKKTIGKYCSKYQITTDVDQCIYSYYMDKCYWKDTQNVRVGYSIIKKSGEGENKEEYMYLEPHCLPSNNFHSNFIYPFLHLLMPIIDFDYKEKSNPMNMFNCKGMEDIMMDQ